MVIDALKIFADSIIKRRSSIMTAGSCAGTIATFIFTIKAGKKAVNKEGFEKVKPYILPGAICAGTCALNVFNDSQNIADKKVLIAGMAGIAKLYSDRRLAEKEVLSEDDQSKISNRIAERYSESIPDKDYEEKELFYDDFSNQWFRAKPEWVFNAEKWVNEVYKSHNYNCANEFYMSLIDEGVEEIELLPEFDRMGWAKWYTPKNDICPSECVTFTHTFDELADNTKYTTIHMYPEPELEYYGW